MSLINREALYKKACGLEAQALAYVGKIANDETRTEEWRIWSAILAERTAFKHDIFDAPEVKPEMKWIPVSERLPEKYGKYLVTFVPSGGAFWTCVLVARYSDLMGISKPSFHVDNPGKNDFQNITEQVTAWMPLPEPYREENR